MLQIGQRGIGRFVDALRSRQRAAGIHNQPPDQALVPPSTDAFSATMTLAPCTAAVTAAESPAAPDPTTSTSTFSQARS